MRKKTKVNEKEIIFMEVLSDFLEDELGIDRAEALAHSCIVLDELKKKGVKIK